MSSRFLSARNRGGSVTRTPRAVSSSGINHVIARGNGRRLLFEDDNDRRFYLDKLAEYKAVNHADVLAWCLMENHVHLLIQAEPESLTSLMRSLGTSFARYYNGRHGHVGSVFQGRYRSIPEETDGQLLETVRYIHNNPQVAGISAMDDYQWSSYGAYLVGHPLLNPDLVMGLLGGVEQFVAFHEAAPVDQGMVELRSYGGKTSTKRAVMPDSEAVSFARRLYGDDFASSIAAMPKAERDAAVARLRGAGLSIRQIERLTGIGRNIIQRCPVWPGK